MALTKEKKIELVGNFRQHEKDTGSAEVQIALLTERIQQMTEHMRRSRKDFHSQRGLMKMVSKRSRLLRYLSDTDYSRYQAILGSLGLRK